MQHSLSTDLSLETFDALDGDSGDVYSAQCNVLCFRVSCARGNDSWQSIYPN